MSHHEADILLVEDNYNDAELAMRVLQKNEATARILHVSNGAEALDYLFGHEPAGQRKTPLHLKLILLDLKMPRVDGFEVLQRIKADALTKKIPVVVLTSSREPRDIARCYDMGISSYIVKPVDYPGYNKALSAIALYWLLVNEPPV